MTRASTLLELLNGGAITPEAIWLVLLTIYLVKESRRRGLHAFDWLHLPPSMNLILAIYITDAGVTFRSIAVWGWRYMGGAPSFNPWEAGALIVGSALIVVGFLCKIRALTAPDHGDGPWLFSLIATVAAILVLVAIR